MPSFLGTRSVLLSTVAAAAIITVLGVPATSGMTASWTRWVATDEAEIANGVAVDATGVTVAGFTYGSLKGPSNGSADAYLRRYTPEGDQVWTRQFGTSDWDYLRAIAADEVGVTVTGGTSGTLVPPKPGAEDVFVRQYRRDGSVSWTRQFGTSGWEEGTAIAYGSPGIAVAGATSGSLARPIAYQDWDMFVRLYDIDGMALWTRQFGTTDIERARGVAVDATGVTIAGTTFAGHEPGDEDIFIRRYGVTGNHLWTRHFGTPARDHARAIAADDHGITVVGYTRGAIGGPNQGFYDVWLRRYTFGGSIVWTRQFGTVADDQSNGLASDAGGVTIVGDLYSPGPESRPLNRDPWIRRYRHDGTVLSWLRTRTPDDDFLRSVGAGPDGITVAGGRRDDVFVTHYEP